MLTTTDTIESGNEIRIYQEDDWFIAGHVTDCCDETVTVDFEDHIVIYNRTDLRPDWAFYKKYYSPLSEGRLIRDYRPQKNR